MHLRSIRIRLSLVFILFLLLVIGLGLFSMNQLERVDRASAEIRDRWLQTTRILGDINNYTSDFRSAEGSRLLSTSPEELAQNDQEIEALDGEIDRSFSGYLKIHHDPDEDAMFARFASDWKNYRMIVRQEIGLSGTDGKERYMTDSRKAFDVASDALAMLTNWNVEGARAATEYDVKTYRLAYGLILGAMLAAGAMLVLVVVHITRSISNPLLELANHMHRLIDHETLTDIGGTDRTDEIGEMARSVVVFRDNAIELDKSRKVLAEQAVALRETLESERRLTRQQRNIVSMTSHEFRTPLTVIDGHAQRLIRMKDRLSPEEISQRAGKIRNAVLRMTNLMDSLLNSSRFLDGDAEFHPEEIDLARILHEACQTYREIQQDISILEHFSDLPETMTGDPKLLYQAFSNLLSNAIKYSGTEKNIEIAGKVDGEWVSIDFIDRGIGIPEKDQERLFERYYRGSNVSNIAGTGVGLHFVEKVVGLHGGSISVQSREGAGSRFTILLPIRTE
ncbi:MAG: HAMP domain-containing protein [Burkholderiales bacterium]|nr:HAMP domain-containing protein [Burkholderiales bacterium]